MAVVKPLVFKKGGKKRFGKGFSQGELKEVKLSLKQALKLGIPVDFRRRTAHENNIKTLKEFQALLSEKVSKPTGKVKTTKVKSVKKRVSSSGLFCLLEFR